MKNPMTREQKHQAIDDNEDGHDMQAKRVTNRSSRGWFDRTTSAGSDLDFSSWQYRRKPELIERFVKIRPSGDQFSYISYQLAKEFGPDSSECRMIRLVEDPDWVEPEPEQDTNPWRLVIDGSTPECNPVDIVTFKYMNGSTFTIMAGDFNWSSGNATHWRYAEDE